MAKDEAGWFTWKLLVGAEAGRSEHQARQDRVGSGRVGSGRVMIADEEELGAQVGGVGQV